MLLIVVILTVAYILIPLIELIVSETVQRIVKLVVYALAFLWLMYQIFIVSKVV